MCSFAKKTIATFLRESANMSLNAASQNPGIFEGRWVLRKKRKSLTGDSWNRDRFSQRSTPSGIRGDYGRLTKLLEKWPTRPTRKRKRRRWQRRRKENNEWKRVYGLQFVIQALSNPSHVDVQSLLTAAPLLVEKDCKNAKQTAGRKAKPNSTAEEPLPA